MIDTPICIMEYLSGAFSAHYSEYRRYLRIKVATEDAVLSWGGQALPGLRISECLGFLKYSMYVVFYLSLCLFYSASFLRVKNAPTL
jgi:hypothetical protein